ncbi:MAG: HAD family hydrolase, partial [Oscillospiraceae bacterium]|nr:HAD family hydrolase [Oscillospiraceae bacterium]
MIKDIRGIVFDIGQTLAYYPIPLNWSALYRPAFGYVAERNGLALTESDYGYIADTLAKYNTRINPREEEVSSDTIFTEIINGTSIPKDCLDAVREDFYSYFRTDVYVYEDAAAALRAKGIITATFSDVAYGMDNRYALEDIRDIIGLIDIPFTSNDAGFRKPNKTGLMILSGKMGIPVSAMMFVGDEEKDIKCALSAGAVSV